MNLHTPVRADLPDFTAYPAWADRIAAYRGTFYEMDMLASILVEAGLRGDLEMVNAVDDAMNGDWTDLFYILEEEAAWERVQEAGAYYPGREVPDTVVERIMGGGLS